MLENGYSIRKVFFALGTVNSITIFDRTDEEILNIAKERVMEIHELFNVIDCNSEISILNRNAGKRNMMVSDDMIKLLTDSMDYRELTYGAFDILAAPLSLLWKESLKSGILPDEDTIKKAKKLTDDSSIIIDGRKRLAMLGGNEQKIDMGGIAKGYAADEVKRILVAGGIKEAVINLGGTVTVIGKKQRVGLQIPFDVHGNSFAYVEAENVSIVSSGLYEQHSRIGDKEYHHIIDPRTGYPADSELLGITLIGESAEELDAMSTAIFVLGIRKGYEILNGIEAVFITKDRKVFATEGLKNGLVFGEREGAL